MSTRAPGAAWQREDVAAGFLDERRRLIPLWDVQEELARRLITRGGRRIDRFCDLGAGDGGFAELVMEAHPGSTCVLVDFSEPMLRAAETHLGDKRDRCRVVRADLSTPEWLEALPSGERYDAVVSRLCIHHLPDERKRRLYGEAFALLDPGGLFLNWEHVSAGGLAEGMFEEYFVQRLLDAELEREQPRPPEEVRRSYDDAHDEDILAPAEAQCEWLREVGFEDVEVFFKLPELAIFGGVKQQLRREA
jgi:ubiquinone/menaquinone biosynthesis C-methylase UbiE